MKPNVVVLLLDTLRYDYAMTIPQFRQLAERGWVFERMYGGSTFTYPNLCSLRSGLYPYHHGWRTFPQHDPFQAATTLEAELEKAGYTIAMPMECPPPEESWSLGRPAEEPFFRFCWFMGIHDCVYSWECNGVPKHHYEACALCCTDWLDWAFELFSDSYILLFGDHGVGLRGDVLRNEGHDVGAGQVYDFRIHIPCVLAGPGLEHRAIPEAYSLADLMPTILELLDLPIPEGLDGVPVGKRTEPVFLEAQSPNSIWPSTVPNVFGATDGKLKAMVTPDGWRCYDLQGDPNEKTDRADLLRSKEGQRLVATVRDHTGCQALTACLDDIPWWTMEAISYLEDQCLCKSFQAFEWGTGRSTLWLARRVDHVFGVEDNQGWYDWVSKSLETCNQTNVSLVCPQQENYADYILRYANDAFDLVSIDGLERERCLTNALSKLKPGGYLVFDNSQLPEYDGLFDRLAHWERRDFVKDTYPNDVTTVWRKPR